ncbi:MAG: glycerate kinase [Verrucomicrobiota bacterium]
MTVCGGIGEGVGVRILVAADKFKGGLTALEAGEAIQRGLEAVLGNGGVEIEVLPVADGGEGTVEAVREACGGERVECEVRDALGGAVSAEYALVGGKDGDGLIGVLEMSQASGLWRLAIGELDPAVASTFGTGELMRDAIGRGATRLLVGIGGSATNDGGAGMAEALGYRFFDEGGELMRQLPRAMEEVGRLEAPEGIVLGGAEVEVACDVTNPLLGPAGATRVFGGQKGIGEEMMDFFEGRLARLAGVVERDLGGAAVREVPGSGAAGGLGWGLMVFCGASLRPGFEMVAEAIGLEARIRGVDLVVTGEGRIDAQSAMGKAPGGVAALAREHGKPVLAVGGAISLEGEDREAVAETFDLTLSIEGVFPEVGLKERIERNGELLEACLVESPELVKKFAAGGSRV